MSLETFKHNVTCNKMCLKFSEVLLDCVGHAGVGDTSHGSVTCSPSALSPESPAPLWQWEVLQMSLEHAKGGLQAGIVMLLLLTSLGEEILPLGAAPGAVLTAPPPVHRTEL